MTKQVQRRRGTASQHTSFTGAEGEISVNTTNKSVHVHDGVTAGGVEAARADLANVSDASLNTALAGNTLSSLTITSADINGGTIDGTVIGGTTPAAVTATSLTATGTTTLAGASTTADITFGDNDKAIFGAGSDLQIYHDGANNWVDAVSGAMFVRGSRVDLRGANNEMLLVGNQNGNVSLYYDNAAKLATTSTGVDVTGTVTADGLTVDNGVVRIAYSSDPASTVEGLQLTALASATGKYLPAITWGYGASTPDFSLIEASRGASTGGRLHIKTATTAGTMTERLRIDESGDISFYEDTGTTPKFFWDASAEALGIGTSSPARGLHVNNNGESFIRITSSDTGNAGIEFGDQSDGVQGAIFQNSTDNSLRFNGYNNSERMRIDASGNVGIGTSSPSAKLEVTGDVQTTWETASTKFVGSKFSTTYDLGMYMDTDNRKLTLSAKAGDSTGTIAFQTGVTPSEAMRIDNTGRVGIGTSSPAAPLDVGGNIHARGVSFPAFKFANSSGTALAEIYYGVSAGDLNMVSNQAGGRIGFQTAGSERMRIDSSGNVGIGTSSPSAKLHLIGPVAASGATSPIATFSDGTRTAQVAITGSAYSYAGAGANELWHYASSAFSAYTIGSDGAVPIKFISNSSERMRIDASGNLLVGTTIANGTLSLANNGTAYTAYLTGNSSNGYNLLLRAATTPAVAIRFLNSSGADVGSIDTTATATSYNTSSDYRLKEDVQPMTGASDRVLALKPVNFAWKADGTRTDGFLAHEAQAVAPYAVTGEKDGEEMQSIDHSKLVPLLTAALQEALGRIETLEAEVAALKA